MNDLVKKEKARLLIHNTAWNSLSENTKLAYEKDYKQFFKFVDEDPRNAKTITAQHVLSYIEHLQELEMSNNTINRKIASLSKMFKVLVYTGDIKVNPVEALKQFKRLSFKTVKNYSTPITMKDVRKITKILKSTPLEERKTIMIIRTLARTGFRISEFTGMKKKKIEDYDDDTSIITVLGKGKKERTMFLDNVFLEEIYALYPDKKEIPFLFYNKKEKRYCRKVLWSRIRKFCKERLGFYVHPHQLRHTCATHLLTKKRLDLKTVQLFLGHSDPSTTMVYIDKSPTPNSIRIKI